MKDKEVFKFSELDHEKLAASLGLGTSPQIKFLTKSEKVIGSLQPKSDDAQEKFEPKLTRLQKLKLKIKSKKDQKKKDKEQAVDEEIKEADVNSDHEEDEEDFFVSKKDQREFNDEVEE